MTVYHIAQRGVGRQAIFEDDADRKAFGSRLRRALDKADGKLLAWCFMDNHVHLLVNIAPEWKSRFAKALFGGYAKYFNNRHDRTGHLLEGRPFVSVVETDEQLLATVRYIHHNPAKAGLGDYSRYPWSSYAEYVGRPFITNTELVLELFDGVANFEQFHKHSGSDYGDPFAPVAAPKAPHVSDEAATDLALSLTGLDSPSQIASLDKKSRNHAIAQLKAEGVTVRQIARLTGLGRNIIQRA